VAGIGPGDTPAFAGMHEASASVAGGSLRAMEAILRGDVWHAFHPGGGLHHAMPDRASGFCVYNDPALAIQRARDARHRVLYLDFDVHHGDGVEEIHRADPGVMTFSIHETGESLFPGTGFVADDGPGAASGTVVNVPLDAGTGAGPWLAAVQAVVPELAAAFGPDVIVSQHGCDGHAWDPLAHLRLTTTAMGAAARLVDRLAHRHAAGRWLSTGGGGYDAYRVVPRAWSLVWLAAAHRDVPDRLPDGWRQEWAAEAARYGTPAMPEGFEDDEDTGQSAPWVDDAATRETVELVRRLRVPAILRHARDAGWWRPDEEPATKHEARGAASPSPEPEGARPAGPGRSGSPAVIVAVEPGRWASLRLAERVIAPLDPEAAHDLVAAGLASSTSAGCVVSAAVEGGLVVGLAISALDTERAVRELLAVGVAPDWRRQGLGTALLAAHVQAVTAAGDGRPFEALVTAAERDPVDPLDGSTRRLVARHLLEAAGFGVDPAQGSIGRAGPGAIRGIVGTR
jgi:acetoin utilization protein AcuC